MTAVWDDIKTYMKTLLPENGFSLWIDPITFVECTDNNFVLSCPNKFSRNWVMENYSSLIRDALHKAGEDHLSPVFYVQPSRTKRSFRPCPPDPDQLTLPHLSTYTGRGALYFNKAFTFDRFIVGRSNEFAYSASKALAREDQRNYHMLLMLANTGLGKTHLAQAAGQAILEQNPEARVYYITAEQFTNEMISSLKNNRIEAFKDKYRRSCDFLLLDEINFLCGKEKIQAELEHTLDALANANKKIIFTSSRPPKHMPRISQELTSRLTSGLVTTIRRPDYDTRVNILKKKASEHNLGLSLKIVHFLANHLKRDIRQLESAITYLKAKSEFQKANIDLDHAKDILNCLVSHESNVTSVEIHKLVCKYYKVDPEMLRSKSRKRVHTYPRNIYAYLCRRHTDEALEKIAKTINRSHSTVLHAAELVERKMKTDANMRNQITFLTQRLEQR
ncbi:MAG: chromosomal replication initiator protein DnaA [Deltaproteobacteria bacterium]|nr:chromosomal replication initiator protein DnaA [Deltaproteobacteria bacterium]